MNFFLKKLKKKKKDVEEFICTFIHIDYQWLTHEKKTSIEDDGHVGVVGWFRGNYSNEKIKEIYVQLTVLHRIQKSQHM